MAGYQSNQQAEKQKRYPLFQTLLNATQNMTQNDDDNLKLLLHKRHSVYDSIT
ncbi:hypothetical protein Q757_05585 [Oenococcus alcoholitolerans]|uniref:Uncharacterized protein n=1 Tax=Oenococcus alcoholitolerans TaxID=931074 RepID=A0ABR4XQP7_9LACO|nr:hypothetical protein Q757_05585 [Oenococcus alcoholitolerans]